MIFHPEADPLEAGCIRLTSSHTQAPYVSHDTKEAIRALEEAPDGYRFLDWSGQGLKRVPSVPNSFRNARVANLADNKLMAVPAHVTDLKLLLRLSISNNSISQIPDYLGKLEQLRELRAADNSIGSVSGLEKLQYLALLDLQRNQLEELPDSLSRCTQLHKLLVSTNRLQRLPSSYSRLVTRLFSRKFK